MILDHPARWNGAPRIRRALALATLLVLVGAASLPGQSRERLHAEAVRVERGPVIDGSLDEEVWGLAPPIDGFVQQEPLEGAPASERTVVRLLYDDHTLYIGVHAYDSNPAGIVATEMRRNANQILEEDNFQVILDTFRDSRSGYMFVTTPLGARLEQQVFEEGEGGRRGSTSNVNRDWDGVWDVAARQTVDGWTAEIAIPLVTLRFPDQATQVWGINFMRNIARKNEQAYWSPVPKGYSLTRVSLAGTVTGLESLNRGRDLRVKPFVVGGGRRVMNGGIADNRVERDIGLDVKYGITAGLNLDLTLNTDFAQAEVDDERVNLTRFALHFPEKRDFFLENAGQFNVGTTASMDRLADLFFSRRIGLSDAGAHVPIIGGARLTGKVGRNNVAAMSIQTDDAYGQAGENFLVSRYSRDVFERSKVGAIVINKQSMSGGHYNRTFAGDFTLAPHASLTLNGFLARTATPGTSGDEMGGHLRAGWLDRDWNVYAEYTDLQDNFNAEVGFVPRTGIRTSKFHFERTPRPGRFGIRVLEPMWNVAYTTDQTNRLVTRRYHYMLGVGFENGGNFMVWYNDNFERLDNPFPLRRDLIIAPGDYRFGDWRFSYRSNRSQRVYFSATYAPQTFFDGHRTDLDGRLGMRISSQLAAEGQLSRNDVDLPAGSFTADVASLGIDYALSPDMTLRSLTQYNSLTKQWSTGARFHYIYRPGSDLYIVYDEVRRDIPVPSELRDRQLIVKLTYLLSR
jgi:hypothetical protein